MTAARIGIIGARRKRQGLGPFIARFLKDAGAEPCCFLATSADTRDATAQTLRDQAGLEATGYLDLDEMLKTERLDALAILSPAGTHESYLRAALAARLHVLCEKPLVWSEGDFVGATRELAEAFAARGLTLRENCQWPYTLRFFYRLHPELLDAPVTHFEMRLSPSAAGAGMLRESLSHPISLLQALVPGDVQRPEDVQYDTAAADATELHVHFVYVTDRAQVRADIHLVQTAEQPKPAEYAINTRSAIRRVQLPEYALSFEDEWRRAVDLEDPEGLLVRDFVRALTGELRVDTARETRTIVQRAAVLQYLLHVFSEQARGARLS